ncbi:ABC transporter ATP-binding protein [Halalkalicoccus tibetensis]|uniref:ABC transporter ATP-binding protein n=1 Tax=Halalkalicoccus tibetensis TaxID=175632 RepID=A0ABD5V6I8_9EURY
MDGDRTAEDLSWREKAHAFWRVALFKPVLTAGIIVFSVFVALMEGVGLSFLVPIIDVVQGTDPTEADGVTQAFFTAYSFVGIPFSLGTIILGVSTVMTVRYLSSFVVDWFRVALEKQYVRELQRESFDHALDARVAYFDEHGSDDILNAIVTQAEYAGKVIRDFIFVFNHVLLALMYLGIAFFISPLLTIAAVVILGGLTFLIRRVLEPGYTVGDRVAEANEQIQQSAQAGTQGIRDIKLYTKTEDVFDRFAGAVERFTDSSITLARNEAAIENFYNLTAAVTVFVLIYVALTFTELSLGALGVFLFALFQLAPEVSRANNRFYKMEGRLPHLIRTQEFVRNLEESSEIDSGEEPVPEPPTPVRFEDVSFAYNPEEEQVLKDISFSVDKGEFIAFVGQSGAGKSTIISLLARMYEHDEGEISANGVPVERIDLTEWRERVAVVRQDPFIFNDTVRANVTIGNEDATEAEIERACEIAHVTEYLDDLPGGYDTILGDNGVRLSGGQRQRISLARALLKDADILVLDEATSDLDTNIEESVQTEIESMDRDYAIIAIAHRLSTVINADQIYTLQDGEIVEQGEHEELVGGEGKYAQLYSTQ